MPDLDLGPAIEAGAHAVAEQLRLRRNGTDDPFRDSVDTEIDALAKAAIEAALPELRKAIAEEIARLREHAHICSDLLDANEALGHSLTSARGEIERLRRELEEARAAYELKVQDLTRETNRVSILAQALSKDGHGPDGLHAQPCNRHFCRLCYAMHQALTPPESGEAVRAQ